MNVLMITSEWPTPSLPNIVPFVVRQVESLRRAGVEVDVFHFRGSKNPLNYLRAWFGVRGKVSSGRYDLVHAQWGQSALIALPKAVPLVITFRGSDLAGIVGSNGRYTLTSWTLRLVSRSVSRFADKVIVVSERLALHLPKIDCHVIPGGLDFELFRPVPRLMARERLGLPVGGKLVLFAADPTKPVKRFELAKAAVSILKRQTPAEMIVANDVPHEQMPFYMAACDVLLLTSMHEGSPNVVKEALACNLPVVSVDVGDVRERIGGIEGCIICADDSAETIAEGLAKVLNANQIIEGRRAVSDLDERTLTERTIQIYTEVLSPPFVEPRIRRARTSRTKTAT